MTGTALAAAALAALTASQAPGAELTHRGGGDGDRPDTARQDAGDDSYHTELPPLESPAPPSASPDVPGAGTSQSGIPASLLAAYKKAQGSLGSSASGCGLRWELLAAIGKVESGQARGGAVDAAGTTRRPILGPVLDGSGFARVHDTDGGRWDGDGAYDRAVGPLQFIPSTWQRWGADGNGDGARDPNNVFDAALAAGRYLCGAGRELTQKAELDRAVLSYNNSTEYLRTVLAWYDFYRKGTHRVPDGAGPLPTSSGAGGVGGGRAAKKAPHGAGSGKDDAKGSTGSGSGHTPHSRHTPHPGPHEPDKGKPEEEKPGGSEGGDRGHESPSPAPRPGSPAALGPVGSKELSATAGEDFTEPPRVRVTDKARKPVEGARITFEIVGDTDARFQATGGKASEDGRSIVVSTDNGGVAAPALRAGDRAGHFTIKATAETDGDTQGAGTGDATAAGQGGSRSGTPENGQSLTTEFTATVREKPAPPIPQPPRADGLSRTSDTTLRADTNGAFADGAVQVKAVRQGKPVADVPLDATMITDGPLPVQNAKGPYFKDANGSTVRTLRGLTTDKDGLLTLPKIYTDANEGTFTLRVRTADDRRVEVQVKLTVTGK